MVDGMYRVVMGKIERLYSCELDQYIHLPNVVAWTQRAYCNTRSFHGKKGYYKRKIYQVKNAASNMSKSRYIITTMMMKMIQTNEGYSHHLTFKTRYWKRYGETRKNKREGWQYTFFFHKTPPNRVATAPVTIPTTIRCQETVDTAGHAALIFDPVRFDCEELPQSWMFLK